MIIDNSPAFGWVRITNAVVTYKNKIYYVPNDATEKKYIYWDAEHPSRYKTSNQYLSETPTFFLVLINDGGMSTLVHSKVDYFNINFDMGVQETLEKKIYGLYETANTDRDENNTRFSNIVQNIDVITQRVGVMDKNNNTKFSQIDQRAENIQMKVKDTNLRIDDTELRDEVVKSYMDLIQALGQYQISMEIIMADEKLDYAGTGVEQNEIKKHNKIIKNCIDVVKEALIKLTKDKRICEETPLQVENIKDIMIPNMDNLYTDLVDTIEYAGQDRVYNATDKKNIYEQFAKFISVLSGDKEEVSKILYLGYGGTMIETIGNLFLEKDKGGFNFFHRLNDNDKKISSLNVGLDGFRTEVSREQETTDGKINKAMSLIDQNERTISTKVSESTFNSEIRQINKEISSKVSNSEFGTAIKQSSEDIIISINNYTRAYSTEREDFFVFNRNGFTVGKGYVATDTLTVPQGHEPVINLFTENNGGKPQLDASYRYGQGVGNAIRLKWDDSNYLKIYDGNAEFFLNNGNSPVFSFKNNSFYHKGKRLLLYSEGDLREEINSAVNRVYNSVYAEADSTKIRIRSSNGSIDIYRNGEVWHHGSRVFTIGR